MQSNYIYEFIYLRPNSRLISIQEYFMTWHGATTNEVNEVLTELVRCGKLYVNHNGTYKVAPRKPHSKTVKRDKRKR